MEFQETFQNKFNTFREDLPRVIYLFCCVSQLFRLFVFTLAVTSVIDPTMGYLCLVPSVLPTGSESYQNVEVSTPPFISCVED